ncbi:hypothetical protein CSC28_2462 [Pseudomonas paraeruginosa]|nr:hypothetical protein CSC28_2462 [Pseudomonas paraeruginosa]
MLFSQNNTAGGVATKYSALPGFELGVNQFSNQLHRGLNQMG